MASAAFKTVTYPISPGPGPAVPSHILVVGSEGLVGKMFINFALQEGHGVTAFMSQEHPGFDARLLHHHAFSTCKGDVRSEEDVLAAVEGCNAVVISSVADSSSLNPIPEDVIKTFVHACRGFGCHRLICQGNAMASEEAQQLGFAASLAVNCCAPTSILTNQEADEHHAVLDLLYGSALDLEWVVTRPVAVESGISQGTFEFFIFEYQILFYFIIRNDDSSCDAFLSMMSIF